MKDDIERRVATNLERVEFFLDTYRVAAPGAGRKAVKHGDFLRAAVVFLHAALEDALRSAVAWKWPHTCVGLDKLEFVVGGSRVAKIGADHLAASRGLTVEDFLATSVNAFLERSSFNNLGVVKLALKRAGVSLVIVDPHESKISAMMARRHLIAHRGDRHEKRGSGHHGAASISLGTVEEWTRHTRALCQALVAAL